MRTSTLSSGRCRSPIRTCCSRRPGTSRPRRSSARLARATFRPLPPMSPRPAARIRPLPAAAPAPRPPAAPCAPRTASLATVWELDVWGRVRRTVESNRESAQASAGDLAAMLLSEQATLAQSYFQLRVTDLDLGLLERSMAAYEKALEVTRNRYQAGVAQRYDVTQAQTQLENVRAQHVDLGITRATLEHAIAVLVGRPPAALSIPRKEQAPAIPAIPLTLPSQLLERRPDIAAAERRAAAANAQIGIARAAWFPTLSLGGSEGYASSGFSGLFQVPNRFWSLGPDLVGTLVDFGARRYQVRAASASYDQSVATYRQTVLSAFQEVE